MVLRTYLYYEERLARDAALQYETFVLLVLRVVCVLLYIVLSLLVFACSASDFFRFLFERFQSFFFGRGFAQRSDQRRTDDDAIGTPFDDLLRVFGARNAEANRDGFIRDCS